MLKYIGSHPLEPFWELLLGDVFPEAGLGPDSLVLKLSVLLEVVILESQVGVGKAVAEEFFVEHSAVGQLDPRQDSAVFITRGADIVQQNRNSFV